MSKRTGKLITDFRVPSIAIIGLALIVSLPLQAEDEKLGWSDAAELSILATSGNAKSETLGLNNTLTRKWEEATFTLQASALRAKTTTASRAAFGDPAAFDIVDTSNTKLSAETYLLRGRYEGKINERMFWFTAASWDRNEFAGIKNRMQGVGGAGHLWFDHDTARLSTDYGITYTQQDDVVDLTAGSDSFLGARLSYDYWRKLSATTEFASVLIVDLNADETSDTRADILNSLGVSMSERLALKLSLHLLYDNQPSFAPAPLFALDGTSTGLTVPARADDLDSIFSVALVVDF